MVDLRPYAERIAKAWPERFEFVRSNILKPHWHLEDRVRTDGKCPRYVVTDSCGEDAWWAFIGPLLDELEVEAYTLYDCEKPTWLEAAFTAVAAELEKRGEGKS